MAATKPVKLQRPPASGTAMAAHVLKAVCTAKNTAWAEQLQASVHGHLIECGMSSESVCQQWACCVQTCDKQVHLTQIQTVLHFNSQKKPK